MRKDMIKILAEKKLAIEEEEKMMKIQNLKI